MNFRLVFLYKLVWWPASFRVLAFGNITALNINIIVFGLSVSTICGIWGIFLSTTTSIFFNLCFGFVIEGNVRVRFDRFSHDDGVKLECYKRCEKFIKEKIKLLDLYKY